MVEALLENTCNCLVSSFPAASLQTHSFAFVVLGTNHFLVFCFLAWPWCHLHHASLPGSLKPWKLGWMQVAQPFLFPLHLMQPSNPWYWLLDVAWSACWSCHLAWRLCLGLGSRPFKTMASGRCFHSCGLCLCLGHDFPANSETLETESKFSERLKSNPVFCFLFQGFWRHLVGWTGKTHRNLM